MPEVSEWWLHITDYGPEVGSPSRAAFTSGHAQCFDSLDGAIKATVDVPQDRYAWIAGDDVIFDPDQLKPLRKLLYGPRSI